VSLISGSTVRKYSSAGRVNHSCRSATTLSGTAAAKNSTSHRKNSPALEPAIP